MSLQGYRVCDAITLNDTTEYTPPYDAFLITATGNLVVVTEGGQTVTFTALAANVIVQISCKIFKATGSTATVRGLRR